MYRFFFIQAPETSSCDGMIKYKAKYRHKNSTQLVEEDCQTHSQCTITDLDAVSTYFIRIIASNNGDKTTQSTSMLTAETGEKSKSVKMFSVIVSTGIKSSIL